MAALPVYSDATFADKTPGASRIVVDAPNGVTWFSFSSSLLAGKQKPLYGGLAESEGLSATSLWPTLSRGLDRAPGLAALAPIRNAHGCAGAAKHIDVRERPPGQLVEPRGLSAPSLSSKSKRGLLTETPFLIWRRARDSNPRTLSGQRFSRPPLSTTQPALLKSARG